MSAFSAHIRRHELENETERFARAPAGTFARFYTRQNLQKPLTEPGWARIWVARFAGQIVAHASLYDMGEPDGVVFGHIGVEKPYRGWRLAAQLQKQRLAFCDVNGLTLVGAVAQHNDTSFHGCRRNGFEYLRYDAETKEIWLYRPPRGANPGA